MMTLDMTGNDYEERLKKKLSLTTLKTRRSWGDLIEVFKNHERF